MPQPRLRLAVVGRGCMGRTHVDAIARVPEIELAGVIRHGELAEALKNPEIDAVDLCVPTDVHASLAMQALRAGKHVLVEKPMALDAASCDRMIAEAERRDRMLMVAHMLRFSPAYMALECPVKEEAVQSAAFHRRCGPPGWAAWFRDASRSGGGAFDLLIHDADMALRLFGHPHAISATGAGDVLNARLFYSNGLCVEISGGWLHDGVPFSMDYTVVTDRATYDYDSRLGAPRRYPSDGFEVPAADVYAAEIAYFAGCVLEGRKPERCAPRESAEAVRLMLALIAARKRNGEKIAWISE